MSCDIVFTLWLTHFAYRMHPDNSELVENAATLLMELANYRESIAMSYKCNKKSHCSFININ